MNVTGNVTGLPEFLMAVIGPLLLLAALIYGVMRYRRHSGAAQTAADAKVREIYQEPDGNSDAVSNSDTVPLQPAARDRQGRAIQERVTEDDIAQASLGGTRGSRDLGDAPMVPQQGKNTPRRYEPGHTA